MVAPLIPIAVGLGGAALGGAAIASWLGKESDEAQAMAAASGSPFAPTAPFSISSQTYAPHAPYETYSSAIQYAPVTSIQYPDYAINIGSPEAVATTKKEQTVTSRPEFEYAAEQAQAPASAGIDLMPIAIIGAVALVAVVVLKEVL